MAERKRNPTNADLLKEIKTMQNSLTTVMSDVEELKTWRVAVMAVDEYKRREREPQTQTEDKSLNKELIKALIYALTAITGLIALMQGVK